MKTLLLTADVGDVTIMNLSSTVPPGESEGCVQILAVDDEVVEENEVYTVFVQAENANDRVNGSVTIIITDNDGTSF